MLQVVAATCAAIVVPAAIGWRTLLTASPARQEVSRDELDSFVGAVVVDVTNGARFRARTPYGDADILVPADARVWAATLRPYTPSEGDTFDASGSWQGVPGNSLFTVERIWFNLERVRGLLTTDSTVAAQGTAFTVDSDKGRWNVRIEADKLTSATVLLSDSGPEVTGMDAARAAKAGWAIDMIGFREPDGTLLVTWVEFYPPPGRADGG
jgi:hypothetical protein